MRAVLAVSCTLALAACHADQSVVSADFSTVVPASFSEHAASEQAAGSMHLAWIDTHAFRTEFGGYTQWNVDVGLCFQFRNGAYQRLKGFINITLPSTMFHSPKECVQVQRIDGQPVAVAPDFYDRHNEIVEVQTHFVAQRTLADEEGGRTHIGLTSIALGEELKPGIYRMRLKANAWQNADDLVIDDSWQSFIITDSNARRTPVEELPWYDLPKPEAEDEKP